MRVDVVSIFPEMFSAVADCGITSRARKEGLWSIKLWNPRDFVHDAHKTVDDRPFGGGPGMIMLAEPLAKAVEAIRADGNQGKVISFAPSGRTLSDGIAREFSSQTTDLILICGRYEGIDQRFLDVFVDETLSIGDYVISGGELAAMVLIDAMVRLIPGAIKDQSALDESFATGLLDCPHYTRPEQWRGIKAPEVLLGGNHKEVDKYNRRMALQITETKRPDLITIARSQDLLSDEDEQVLKILGAGVKKDC